MKTTQFIPRLIRVAVDEQAGERNALGQFGASAERRQLDEHVGFDDVGARPLQQLNGGAH